MNPARTTATPGSSPRLVRPRRAAGTRPTATPRRSASRQPAFTLTELLVTIAVIIALAAATIPAARFAIHRSRAVTCLGRLRGIGVAIESWLQDHNNRMPDLAAGRKSRTEALPVLDNTLNAYLEAPDAFQCPADQSEFQRSGCSYLWNSTQSGRHKLELSFLGVENQPQSVPLVTDKEAWHPGDDGVNILYADYRISNKIEFRAGP
jgi:type II secretory pathway pseudopilin PulG